MGYLKYTTNSQSYILEMYATGYFCNSQHSTEVLFTGILYMKGYFGYVRVFYT